MSGDVVERGEPWLPGDRIGRIWPSDELRNFSADGRAMGRRAAAAFRAALNPSGDRREGEAK